MRAGGAMTWLSVLGSVLLLGAGPLVIAAAQQDSAAAPAASKVITLKIEGWTCASCEKDIRRALLAVPGVKAAEVSYARGGAIVEGEPGRVSQDQLVQAVASAGNILSSYRATVVPYGSLEARRDREEGVMSWLRDLFR